MGRRDWAMFATKPLCNFQKHSLIFIYVFAILWVRLDGVELDDGGQEGTTLCCVWNEMVSENDEHTFKTLCPFCGPKDMHNNFELYPVLQSSEPGRPGPQTQIVPRVQHTDGDLQYLNRKRTPGRRILISELKNGKLL